MKNARQQKIIELIDQHTVCNQDGLLQLLKEEGYPVTQATISRDIRKLHLIKRANENGVYRYVLPDVEPPAADLFSGSIVSADHAGNTVVLRCRPGTAQAVCAELDRSPMPDVVGTLAGEDTIFMLIRTPEQAKHYAAQMRLKIKG